MYFLSRLAATTESITLKVISPQPPSADLKGQKVTHFRAAGTLHIKNQNTNVKPPLWWYRLDVTRSRCLDLHLAPIRRLFWTDESPTVGHLLSPQGLSVVANWFAKWFPLLSWLKHSGSSQHDSYFWLGCSSRLYRIGRRSVLSSDEVDAVTRIAVFVSRGENVITSECFAAQTFLWHRWFNCELITILWINQLNYSSGDAAWSCCCYVVSNPWCVFLNE